MRQVQIEFFEILGFAEDDNNIAFFDYTELAYNANIFLFAFNLFPIYPLDGSKLVTSKQLIFRYT